MILKYNVNISDRVIEESLSKMTNQLFKILPMREEDLDWKPLLTNLMYDLIGMRELFNQKGETVFFLLLCKIEVMLTLTQKDDFFQFRRLIFECLNLMGELKKCCMD